jgi:uncharacterized protein (TIGR03032 family)
MQKPFFYYSNSFPEFLHKNNISIVFSTYQAGKVIVIGSSNGKSLQLFAKNFIHPMGIALREDQMAVASRSKVDLFVNSPALAHHFPEKPGHYEALYVPQASYHTGMADIHEIEWGNEGLWAVNTAFSCLCLMDEKYSFVPRWKPNFISELLPEDRCHLNGMAMKDGEPAYVTLFDHTDTKDGWRNGNTETGIIMDVKNQNIMAEKLPMPHSPLLVGNSLFFLLSANGKVIEMDTVSGKIKEITQLDNFLRGLAIFNDYLIIGASGLRESSKAFENLEIKNKDKLAGIYIIDRNNGEQVAKLTFTDHIKEIFSVKVLPNVSRVAMVTDSEEWAHQFIYTPNEMSFWVKQKNKQ